MSIMAQAIASEAIVEEKEREINHVSVASEVDKAWKEYWELSGIDSSYYTKEAREEIEAQLRDEKSGATEKEAEVTISVTLFFIGYIRQWNNME
ncbi:uncharacterized protein TNCV_5033131 [Trichonephila clavipes]|nr:uncharacterized protein TNCV_5033131 [Trichonephila clavipes]